MEGREGHPPPTPGKSPRTLVPPRVHSVRFNRAEVGGSRAPQQVAALARRRVEVAVAGGSSGTHFACPPLVAHLQYSVHVPSTYLARELALVFPALPPGTPLLVIPTFLRSTFSLLAATADSQLERDVCLVYALAFARRVQHRLDAAQAARRMPDAHEEGPPWWVDMTDPASGYPLTSPRGAALYPDVDGAAHLLGYETLQVQCCRLLHHPVWGGHNYPATLFTTAPLPVLERVLRECVDGALDPP